MDAQHRRSPTRRLSRSGPAASRRVRGGRTVPVAAAVAAVASWLVSVGLGAPTGALASLEAAMTQVAPVADATTAADAGVERVRAEDVSRPRRDRAGRWYTVLAHLDAVRERAWRQGSTAALDRVYAEGSPEHVWDRRNLRAYLARGLRVEGVSLTVRRLTIVEAHADRVRLRVVDELGPVEATTADGRARTLPKDRPTCHLIDLERESGWRIARIVATPVCG